MGKPRRQWPNARAEASDRPEDCSNDTASKCASAITGRTNTEPTRDIPATKDEMPAQARFLGNRGKSASAKLETDDAKPACERLRRSGDAPEAVLPKAGRISSEHAIPRVSVDGLYHANCRNGRRESTLTNEGAESGKATCDRLCEGADGSR